MSNKNTALQVTQKALYVVSPMLGRLMEITTGSTDETEEASKHGSIDDLRREAERQELTMHMTERQAKVAQELALARRIETADEVEMEEFYDLSGSAHAGLKTDGSTVSAGLGAQGQKVTKRIFRFKGRNAIQQTQ